MKYGAAKVSNTHRRAFSLLEFILVIDIIAVLAAIASPRYAQSIARYRVDMAVRRVINDLTVARERARSLGTSQTVVFNTSTDSYQISGLEGLNDSSSTYTVVLSDKPYRADLISADFGGDSTVSFNGYGVPDSGGSVVLELGNTTKTIVLDAQLGKAEVQ